MCTAIVPYSKQIPLSKTGKNKGKYFALVGWWWYEWLNQWNWHIHKQPRNNYADTNIYIGNNKQITIKMHRVILGLTDPKILGDHEDRNGLNNLPHNLRACTHKQNAYNRSSAIGSASKYVGVSILKRKNKQIYWQALIKTNGKIIYLGIRKHEDDAAKLYDQKAKELFGEFANLNFKEL